MGQSDGVSLREGMGLLVSWVWKCHREEGRSTVLAFTLELSRARFRLVAERSVQ